MKVKVIGGDVKGVKVQTVKVSRGSLKKIADAAKAGTLKVKTVKF